MSDLNIVNPAVLHDPSGYNHGIRVPPGGHLLFVSGQIGTDRDGKLIGGFVQQFDQALGNVLAVVSEAGGRPEAVAKLTIFVTDRAEYAVARVEVGQVYRSRMGKHFPAMSLVEVKGLLEPGARVEIEGVALIS